MLCDAYFHDYARNVLYNINEVVKFNNNENIISDDMLNLYMKFLNFNELDDQQIQDLVMNIDNKEYVKSLYEDYRRCTFID